jgi:hypothetical protein
MLIGNTDPFNTFGLTEKVAAAPSFSQELTVPQGRRDNSPVIHHGEFVGSTILRFFIRCPVSGNDVNHHPNPYKMSQ